MKGMGRNVFTATILVLCSALSLLGLAACTAFGAKPEGARLEAMQTSPQWTGLGFSNTLENDQANLWTILKSVVSDSSDFTEPEQALPVEQRRGSDYDQPPASGLRVTWLGHSTLLLEIDGSRVLIDPVWGKRASPLSWLGPKRWYPPPLALEELPALDAVVISHDHYDHLDHVTVIALREKNLLWVVPLGVGAHLEHWGIPPDRIVELDWWQSHQQGSLTLTATPARHFSGRSLGDRQPSGGPTLWAGWAFIGPKHRAYYSGDTALFNELVDIGERLGPFDLTMIETGAYNALWRDVHLGPEQAVQAHILARGRVMLPVHWALFNLSIHGWTEPVERVLQAAEERNVSLILPKPGGRVEPTVQPQLVDRWWPERPWKNSEQSPVISSGLKPAIVSDMLIDANPMTQD